MRRAPPRRRHERRGIGLSLILFVALAIPFSAPTAGAFWLFPASPDEKWPPTAWHEGRIGELQDEELALLLAGAQPGTPAARQLEEDFDRLSRLPPEYADVARVALEGLAEAAWHQQRALAALSDHERQLVRSAGDRPSADPAVADALSRVDLGEVWAAQQALQEASLRIESLAAMASMPSVTEDLARQLGIPYPGQDSVHTGAGSIDRIPARLEAHRGLGGIPEQAQPAVASILDALAGLESADAEPQRKEAILAVAQAIEAARPALEAWASESRLQRWAAITQTPDYRLPDPDNPRPALRLGLPALVTEAAPERIALADALAHLAFALGGDQPDAAALGRALAPFEAIPPHQRDAIAHVLEAAADYVSLSRAQGSSEGLPLGVDPLWGTADDPEDPGQPPEDLDEAIDVEAAQQMLLAAVEDLVSELGPQLDGMDAPCPSGIVNVEGYVAIDPCGKETRWLPEDQAVLMVDLGGDDEYLGRHGGAPFLAGITLGTDPVEVRRLPVSIVIDLGGNDTYDSLGNACAQGAACPDLALGPDPAGLASVQPVGVLVDWDLGRSMVRNTFTAGDRSQGYAGDGAVFSSSLKPGNALGAPATVVADAASVAPSWAGASHGILVEHVGPGATLRSEYVAGPLSQGAGSYDIRQAPQETDEYARGSRGLLLRTVASGSVASGTFEAGDLSQGASQGGVPIPAAGAGVTLSGFSAGVFINAAGKDATSHDSYKAGEWSQGAVLRTSPDGTVLMGSVGILADVAGPGSWSNDTYVSVGHSLGFQSPPGDAPGALGLPAMATFMDGLAPSVFSEGSLVVSPTDGEPGLPAGAVLIEARTTPSASDDTYRVGLGPDEAFGRGQGGFLDVAGQDDYPPSSDGPRNDASWTTTATDTSDLEDQDQDAAPAGAENAWQGFVGLWRAGDDSDDESPLPASGRVLVDAFGADKYLDGPFDLVVTAGGDDTYGPAYDATLTIDLEGDDLYLGKAGAAVGVIGEAGSRVDSAVSQTAPAPGASRARVSLLLDLQGDDRYQAATNGTQGYGADAGTGLLFDLDGNDAYTALGLAQGFGEQGGIGVLVDTKRPSEDPQSNLFLLEDPAGQGQGKGEGGLGALVATAEHNTFEAGVAASGDRDGTSVNLGANQPPAIVSWDAPSQSQPLDAGRPYPFTAQVGDPDGDPVRACWDIEGESEPVCSPLVFGNGTAQASHEWKRVPTTTGGDGGDAPIPFVVRLRLADLGGASAPSVERTYHVANPPPTAAAKLVGPSTARLGHPASYQLPFTDAADMVGHQLVVDWGDGERGTFGEHAVNWASEESGATIRLPAGYAQPGQNAIASNLVRAIDGDNETFATLQFAATNHGPIHARIALPGPRQVEAVTVRLALTPSSDPIRLAIEAVDAEGTARTLRVVPVSQEAQDFTFQLGGFPTLTAIQVTQILPPTSGLPRFQLRLMEVRADGPGATHAWHERGIHEPSAVLFDRFGGSSGNGSLEVAVFGEGPGQSEPLAYLGIGGRGNDTGRGPVTRTSLAALHDYTLLLSSNTTETGDSACIDWGDGTSQCLPVPDRGLPLLDGGRPPMHSWQPGERQVKVSYVPDQGSPRLVTAIHVQTETAFDLRVQAPSATAAEGAWQPLLYLTLGPDAPGTTWHGGIPFLAIVDAAGNDRYTGAVATPSEVPVVLPSVGALDLGAMPSLVVDLAGDDDYLSEQPRTQGFGWRGAAGLLVDAAGDDRYVAPAMAQGSAIEAGVGVLVDLAGADAFNPLPSTHADVTGGHAIDQDPWLVRPASLDRSSPEPAPPGSELLQGAAREGVGLLVLAGGPDLLQAGSRSQGFGAHAVSTLDHYVKADPECTGEEPPANATAAFVSSVLCPFGIADTDPGAYQSHYDVNDPPSQGQPKGGDPWCFGGPGSPLPAAPCKTPETARLQEFLVRGPRPGPGTGGLLQLGGVLGLHAIDSSQGAAEGGGHALVFDADGADLLLASTRSQAASQGGSASTILGGGAAFRLLRHGQADHAPGAGPSAPGNPEGRAVLIAPLQDMECKPGPCGGGEDGRRLAIDTRSTTALAPSVSFPNLPSGILRSGRLDLQVRVQDLAGSSLFELVGLRVVRDWAAGPGSACAGPALAPARAIELGPTFGLASIPIDLDAVGPDGTFVEAGCTELHVFARSLGASSANPAWGHAHAVLHLLPPPRGLSLDPRQSTVVFSDQEAPVGLLLAEPLGQVFPPRIEFRLVGSGGTSTFPLPPVVTDAQHRLPLVAPGLQGVPLADGPYLLEARGSWSPTEPPGAWIRQSGRVVLDRSAPQVTADGLPPAWPRREPLPLEGMALDGSGIGSVYLRATNAAGQVLPLVAPACTAPVQVAPFDPLQGSQCVAASVEPFDADSSAWQVAGLEVAPGFSAGVVRLEALAVDASGSSSPWRPLATLVLDAEAPRILSVVTDSGRDSTKASEGLTLRVRLEDSALPTCAAACPAGSGLAEGAVQAVLEGRAGGATTRVPMVAIADPDPAVRAFRWAPTTPIEPGAYRVEVMAMDAAGNLRAHKPGWQVFVDRTEPSVIGSPQLVLPAFLLANGSLEPQTVLKPGDRVTVMAHADDNVGLDEGTFITQLPGALPTRRPGAPTLLGDGSSMFIGEVPLQQGSPGLATVVFEARDRAGNLRQGLPVAIPYQPQPLDVSIGTLQPGTKTARIEWTAAREAAYNLTLTRPDGTRSWEAGHAPAGAGGLTVSGLDPLKTYVVQVAFWDGAGWQDSFTGLFDTLAEPLDTTLALTGPVGQVRSGTIPVSGTLVNPPAGVVRLHAGDPPGPVVASVAVPASSQATDFTLAWDSSAYGRQGLETVPLTAVLDNGEALWTAELQVSVDNRPPDVQLDIIGSAARNGWYPSYLNITARIDADDEQTLPVQQEAFVDGRSSGPTTARIETEGSHEVRFRAWDAAVPPNVADQRFQLRIDRTPPDLLVRPASDRAISNRTLPLQVHVDDARSGFDGVRLRFGNSTAGWSEWAGDLPGNATLAPSAIDGEVFLDVEARDMAGNIRRVTMPFTLDRVGPRLIDARWVGWTAASDPEAVLFIAAVDRIGGNATPTGVEAVRFAPSMAGADWGPWVPADGTKAVAVPAGSWDSAGLRIQLRDAAGNLGNATRVEAPQHDENATRPVSGASLPGRMAPVIEVAGVDPREGLAQERFLFSVVAPSLDGEPPSDVVLQLDGQAYPAEPSGPAMADGSRLYVTALHLAASRFDDPYAFRFIVRYGGPEGVESMTLEQPGPMVLALSEEARPPAGGFQESSWPGGFAMIALAVAAIVARRARRRA